MIGFKKAVNYIFADEEDFSLEHRLFLSACIVGILTSLMGSVINLTLMASLTAVVAPFLLAVLLMALYYFLRFKKIVEPFVFPAIVISFVGISVIWVFNGGINGANIMPAFVILILGLITVSDKNKKYVIALFLLLFVSVYLIQLFRHDLIISIPSEKIRWFDSIFTMLYSSYFIYLIIRYIHKSYTLERLKSEASEEKYRMLTESMKDVVWTLDAEIMRYTYISPSVQKLRGFSPDEIIAQPIYSAYTQEEAFRLHSLMKQRLEEFLNKKDPQPIYYTDEVMQLCHDGSYVWTEIIQEFYRNEKNSRVEVRGVTRDISERKKAEQQIVVNNQELSILNAEKDRFFSIIAHDLISPFHSVIGLCKYLVDKVYEKDLSGVEKYAETIRQASLRIFDLLTNLMAWSHSQTGRLRFKPEKIELNSLVCEVVMLFAEATKQKSITIKTEMPAIVELYADKAMINTILRNLISNAIKFSFPEGTIIISVEENEEDLSVMVNDSGVGIPQKSVSRLFKIDDNYSTQGTCKEQGTGLGLILCKEFIEKHGGRIWVESEAGSGCTFNFTIPKL
jgi:PAS domain S-box-containing protein